MGTMSIGGYTNREYNITGSIDGDDNEVMSILSYGNGPGFRNLMTEGEGNFTQIDRANVTLEKNASAPLKFRQPSASPPHPWGARAELHRNGDVVRGLSGETRSEARLPKTGIAIKIKCSLQLSSTVSSSSNSYIYLT